MLPYDLPNFHVDRVFEYADQVEIHASSTSTQAVCPHCQVLSSRTHGWYSRSPQELPSIGCQIRLQLQVRRFRCMNPSCSVKTFAERFFNWLPPYARRTLRLTRVMQKVSLALGAESGQRVLAYFGTHVSGDTLLRVMRKGGVETQTDPLRVLGVDDWAFKKGKTYGSILVNLETHCVVDLLADRSAETLSLWLKTHPTIEIVSRDRSTDYAAGIRAGAPQAIQVADRWHLLLNLRQMLERYLIVVYARLKALPISALYQAILQQQRPRFQRTGHERHVAEVSRQQRIALYEHIQRKREEGCNVTQLAKELGHHRATIRKYYYATTFPERNIRKSQSSRLDPFLPYLEQRLAQGCENGLQVWREIQTQGYQGTPRQVLQWMHVKRTEPSRFGREMTQLPPPRQNLSHVLPSSQQLAWLLVRDPSSLTPEEQVLLTHLQQDQPLKALYDMTQRFVQMVKNRRVEALNPWLLDCEGLGIVQGQSFALGLRQDYAAVHAPLAHSWSNGQTEGQVNRLKFIKRQMYGRAKFDLLRLRVLVPP